MTNKIKLNLPDHIISGGIKWDQIKTVYQTIEDEINTLKADIESISKRSTISISQIFEGRGVHLLTASGKHYRAKIINAYLLVGDKIKQKDIITIDNISTPLNINTTEEYGKAREFNIKNTNVHFIDEIKITKIGIRRIIITITLESTE